MKFEISNSDISCRLYLSEGGIHFDSSRSIQILNGQRNTFAADGELYFVFCTELMDGEEFVGDGEIQAKQSDWHEEVYLDGTKYYIASQIKFRKIREHLIPIGSGGRHHQ